MQLKVQLNSNSIEQAIQRLQDCQSQLSENRNAMLRETTHSGVDEAKNMAMYMNAYDSGDLVNGIVEEYRDEKGYVHSTAPHTAFVEMGTGIRGQQEPNPNNYYPGWSYDVNEHGEAGWFYIKDGVKHWTKGMPSRPFLYDTAQMLRRSIAQIAERVWRKFE